jgi:hypothetical protein
LQDEVYFLAEPSKALADYCYVHKKKWNSLSEAEKDLRLDGEAIKGWKTTEIDALLPLYRSRRVRTFLKSIRKELTR